MAAKLTADEKTVLNDVLEHFVREGSWPEAKAFRVKHEPLRSVIDAMLNAHINPSNNAYELSSSGLRLLDTPTSEWVKSNLLDLILKLRPVYRAHRGQPPPITRADVVTLVGKPRNEVERLLELARVAMVGLSWSSAGLGHLQLHEDILDDKPVVQQAIASPIVDLEITNLRGVAHGAVRGMTRLTALVGINGCGKSTVLDALYLMCREDVNEAIKQVVERHRGGGPTMQAWLLKDRDKKAVLQVSTKTNRRVTRSIDSGRVEVVTAAPPRDSAPPTDVSRPPWQHGDELRRMLSGQMTEAVQPLESPGWDASLFDPVNPRLLTKDGDLMEALERDGRELDLSEMLKEFTKGDVIGISPGALNGQVELQVVKSNRAKVPLELAGDGIRTAVRLVMVLLASNSKLLLLEEPELHLHPRGMELVARAIVASVKQGTQVVLTTHSLELLGYMNAAVGEDLREEFSLFRLTLAGGELRSRRYDGKQANNALHDLGEDLR